jgi:hypothetical protein
MANVSLFLSCKLYLGAHGRGSGGGRGRFEDYKGIVTSDDVFPFSSLFLGVPRETGILTHLRKENGYGFIVCADRLLPNLYVSFSPDQPQPQLHDEVFFMHLYYTNNLSFCYY